MFVGVAPVATLRSNAFHLRCGELGERCGINGAATGCGAQLIRLPSAFSPLINKTTARFHSGKPFRGLRPSLRSGRTAVPIRGGRCWSAHAVGKDGAEKMEGTRSAWAGHTLHLAAALGNS